MTPPDDLLAALQAAGWRCVECQSDDVWLDYVPALDQWQPVVMHWPAGPGQWCPVTFGGPAARLASLDLLDALAAHMPMSSYGEPAPWHRRERVGT